MAKSDSAGPPPGGQMLIYHDGATRLQVRLEGQTVWLSQRLMAELYQVSVPSVNEHLANIYEEGELDREATIRSFRIVQTEGAREVARMAAEARRREGGEVASDPKGKGARIGDRGDRCKVLGG